VKLQADRIEGTNAIARHGPDGVIVNGREHRSSVVVPWQGEVKDWPVASFEGLTEAHFKAIAELKPELVIFGSGPRIRFPKPALIRPLIDAPSASKRWTPRLPAGPTTCCSPRAARSWRHCFSLTRQVTRDKAFAVRHRPSGKPLAYPIITGYAHEAQRSRILHDASPQQTPSGI